MGLANKIMSCCNGKKEIDAPIKQTNRNRAYKLINRLREVAKEHVPIPESTPDLSDYDKLKKKNKLERRQRKKENQRFRKRIASDKPLDSPKKKKITKCDELLMEVEEETVSETDSGIKEEEEMEVEPEIEQPAAKIEEEEEIVLDTSKRDGRRKEKNKKKNKKRLKMLQQALAFEQERLEEEENRKNAVLVANSKHNSEKDNDDEVDLYPDRNNSRRLNIRLDKCQVKYFDKKEKLKYETVDAYHPDNTPTRSILKKKITKK